MPLAEKTLQFIDSHIDSVDQLEVLRILAANPKREWGSHGLARELKITVEALQAQLEALGRHGLITVANSSNYRYGPQTLELGALLSHLLEAYNERPVTVIRRVYCKPKP